MREESSLYLPVMRIKMVYAKELSSVPNVLEVLNRYVLTKKHVLHCVLESSDLFIQTDL